MVTVNRNLVFVFAQRQLKIAKIKILKVILRIWSECHLFMSYLLTYGDSPQIWADTGQLRLTYYTSFSTNNLSQTTLLNASACLLPQLIIMDLSNGSIDLIFIFRPRSISRVFKNFKKSVDVFITAASLTVSPTLQSLSLLYSFQTTFPFLSGIGEPCGSTFG